MTPYSKEIIGFFFVKRSEHLFCKVFNGPIFITILNLGTAHDTYMIIIPFAIDFHFAVQFHFPQGWC